ncbi:coproporphyrinogen III oxidase [Kordiimonas sediminis]|uniref:Heme chaperone HemW n=1 Tax=Kordiimonas sediminis TaxID=1735581 RepID=A0A919APC0_9PROT|nr:radical SAM family heme chaperone HemW [Kordiimonas sediminis]GHF15627.1 coproporphyrinogen III oxidase [Kordiimonas sediminis]
MTVSLPATSDYDGQIALYIHWPFCERKCPYCDFNSHVRDTVDTELWTKALCSELDYFLKLQPGATVSSIFFGGGTPSLMPPETVAHLIDHVFKRCKTEPDLEITLEANPSSVEANRFRAYRSAGVNRLSVGIQSLRDDALQFLGRLHSVDEAKKALQVARDNFERVSFDLIYARPEMTLESWQAELAEALTYDPDHLSLYQLTIEEGTAFYHQFARGKYKLPDDDICVDLFNLTQDMTTRAGLPAYEVSNHARAGQQSRHNLAYWSGLPYYGIGPGAHGRLVSKNNMYLAHQQIRRPEDWVQKVDQYGHGTESTVSLDPVDRFTEQVMMGLRLMDGINIRAKATTLGISAKDHIDFTKIDDLITDGFMQQDQDMLKFTPKGLPVMNFILPSLFL